jgi:ribosome-associated protein
MSDKQQPFDLDYLETFTEPLLAMKGEEILAMDLRGIAEFADYFILCTGTTDIQVRAIADAVMEHGKANGQRPLSIEGYDQRKWVLIDFVDVVVHVMQPDERKFYGLERLWGDAPMHEIQDTAVPEAS